MKLISKLILFVLSIGVVLGQLERCHTTILVPQHFLNLTKFRGIWYPVEVATAKASQLQPLSYSCLTGNISLTSNPYELTVSETYVALENGTAVGTGETQTLIKWDDIGGALPPHPAVWNAYTQVPGQNGTEHSQSVIVAADESKWAIQYSCGLLNGELRERVLILSRNRTLDPVIKETLDTVAYGMGFPRENFQVIGQNNCA